MAGKATFSAKTVSRRLLSLEAGSTKSADGKRLAVFRVCDRLREPLSNLMGLAGFCSLLSRALALASREIPWLRSLSVSPDGSFSGLEDSRRKLSARSFDQGETAVTAELLRLLVTFIGRNLTMRLLSDIWQKFDGPHFSTPPTL